MGLALIYTIATLALKSGIIKLSEEYIEEGKPHNEELVAKLMPTLRIVWLMNQLGKFLMLLASCKWPSIRYYLLHYHLYCWMVTLTFPVDYGVVDLCYVIG